MFFYVVIDDAMVCFCAAFFVAVALTGVAVWYGFYVRHATCGVVRPPPESTPAARVDDNHPSQSSSPPSCAHQRTTRRGSNATVSVVRCKDCGHVISYKENDRDKTADKKSDKDCDKEK